MTRAFYQWSGGTEADHAALAWFAGARPEQMGPRLATFRGGLTGRAWLGALVLVSVVSIALSVLVALLAPDPGVGTVVGTCVVTAGLSLLVLLAVWLLARRHRCDVHAHGLVASGAWGGAEAIPWATIDPGRVFVATTVRAMTRMPLALYRQQATLPPGVVVNGWTQRPVGTTWWFEAFSSAYRYQPQPSDSPFGWWQLGPTDPRAFLTAMEQAMVADGYPAAGLTPFALSRSVDAGDLRRDPALQRERLLTDPVLGLPPR